MYADYEKVEKELKGKSVIIGKSFFGRNLYAVKFGKGGTLIHGGMHAREHVTTEIVLELIRYNFKHNLLKNVCFIPLVNPDGVELCVNGVNTAPILRRNELLKINGGNDFSLWKANGRAVDLNLNFDADWGKGIGNIRYKAPKGYIGATPTSESETRALVNLTNSEEYDLTLSFHAKGEEVYFGYNGVDPNPLLTKAVSEALGYPAKTTNGSAGGYKDWCVLKKGITAYTVEFGKDTSTYNGLYDDLSDLMARAVRLMETVAKNER